jgi:hypothetical protein
VNGLYEDYDALGWIPAQLQSASIGRFQMAGGDVELTYRTPSTRLTFSEGVTKLVDSSLPFGAPAAGQGLTSQPYGFGNDLANWASSVTKLAIIRDIDKRWAVSSSVIYYSAFSGGEAYANYAATLAIPPSGVPRTDAGNDVPFGPNLYANLGMEYRPSQRWTIRVDGYNLAAPLGQSLSKRNYILRTSEYSLEQRRSACRPLTTSDRCTLLSSSAGDTGPWRVRRRRCRYSRLRRAPAGSGAPV